MPKGYIVPIPFSYTDLSGSKLRPALIIAESVSDVVVSFITTQTQWQQATDVILHPDLINGIKKKSLVRLDKIATINKRLIAGKIGNITNSQIADVNKKLKIVFQI